MSTELLHKITALEDAENRVKNAIEKINVAWGDSEAELPTTTYMVRLLDAASLLERAGGKIRKAIDLLRKAKGRQ